ncbi:hypothetical protein HOK021_44650 [Streptomyces hygroscopicus]|nr:hypothetical protein HOK021_44650 [Streptomyces hygroscopicus]
MKGFYRVGDSSGLSDSSVGPQGVRKDTCKGLSRTYTPASAWAATAGLLGRLRGICAARSGIGRIASAWTPHLDAPGYGPETPHPDTAPGHGEGPSRALREDGPSERCVRPGGDP